MKSNTKERGLGVGIQNWIFLLSSIVFLNIILGTWESSRFDKFIDPMEFFHLFEDFVRSHTYFLALMALGPPLQGILCLVIEKSLVYGRLSEESGMALHVLNAFSTSNLMLVLCHLHKVHPFAAIEFGLVVWHFSNLKLLSYMSVNRILRTKWRENKAKEINEDNIYPYNVNWRNLFYFIYCYPSLVYKENLNPKINLNFKYFLLSLLEIVLIAYFGLNIFYIFCLDELTKAISYINNGQLFEVLKTVIRIAIPIHILWLMAIYRCVLHYVEMWYRTVGHSMKFDLDWWNSEDVGTFWTRWNVVTHEWFKQTIFKPVCSAGISREVANVLVFTFSAFMHAFVFELPWRMCNVLQFSIMMMQLPLNELTWLVKIKYGGRMSNLLLLSVFLIGHPLGITIFAWVYATSHEMSFT